MAYEMSSSSRPSAPSESNIPPESAQILKLLEQILEKQRTSIDVRVFYKSQEREVTARADSPSSTHSSHLRLIGMGVPGISPQELTSKVKLLH